MNENSRPFKPFEPLVERIKKDGICLDGGILKVDSFINHQIDPTFLQSMSIEFVRRFANKEINKILTYLNIGKIRELVNSTNSQCL